MFVLVLSFILGVIPPDSADGRNPCLEFLPAQSRSELPVGSLNEAQQYWTTESTTSPDSLRAFIAQLERTQTCLRKRSPSETEKPSPDLIQVLYWEAILHAALQQFPQAFEAFDQAVAHANTNPTGDSSEAVRATWVPTLHQDRGYLYYLLGDLSASIQYYLKAYKATPKSQPGQQIQFLIDLGLLNQRVQDYQSARHYYHRADRRLRRSSDSLASRSQLQARVHHNQADLLLEQSLSAEFARDSLKRVSTLARRGRSLVDPGTERYALTSLLLSESQGYLGAYDQAYRLNEEVLKYARVNDDVRLQTLSLLKLGVLHVQTERWARADSVLCEALTQAQSLGDLDYQRRILRTLGRLHEMQGDWPAAEQYYRSGVGVIEEYRESLTASQWSMTAFAQWREVYRGLVRALLAQDRPREALTILDRSRARHLQDLRTRARVANQLPPDERARLDSLSRALTDVRNRLGNAALSDDETAALRNRETSLMAARQQLLQIDSSSSRPSLDAIMDRLADQNRALVSYFLDDPWPVFDRSPRSVAFVLTADTLQTISLPGLTQDSVQAQVESVSPLFTSQGKPERVNGMHFDLQPLHTLHEAVYAPVATELPPDQPLTVVPDGPLFHLPFSMLVDSMPGGRYAPSDARFVLHERPTSLELAPSLVADTAQYTHDWETFNPQMAAYGVSDFDTLETVPSALRTALPGAVQDSVIRLPPLPGVQRELDALQSAVPDTRVALNDAANEQSFCRDAQRAGILHVASHAFVSSSSPLQNAILLRPSPDGDRTGGERSSPTASSDGVLFLHELQGQQSRIPLVVLSGCSTAEGTLRGGEGMEGLQYAFRAMGARSTLSNLWPAADEASVELMGAFYQNLTDGLAKDEALRQAQLSYLQNHPQKASPFFWAPTVLYGSPAALPLESGGLPVWAWWALGGLGVVGLVLLVAWYRRNRGPSVSRA